MTEIDSDDKKSTPPLVPKSANEFIEQQLDERVEALRDFIDSDVLAFSGPIYGGVDDLVRVVVEGIAARDDRKKRLLVVLTTSGGYIEVVQRIVDTLRHHFDHVSFAVPNFAFSAGTVLAMSGDDIYMDYYSRLGPIDPQVSAQSGRSVPALGYLIQWERLLEKAKKGELTEAEAGVMLSFDQAELYQYEQARELSVMLLKEWLVKYKFKDWVKRETTGALVTLEMRETRANEIALELNNTERWHSHGHGISMAVLQRDLKLRIEDLDQSPPLCDRIKQYYGLLDDYMQKRGDGGILHTRGTYVPFM